MDLVGRGHLAGVRRRKCLGDSVLERHTLPVCFSCTPTVLPHSILLTAGMWGVFPTPSNSLRYQLGVLQFSSDTNWSQYRPHGLKAQSHKTALSLDASCKYWVLSNNKNKNKIDVWYSQKKKLGPHNFCPTWLQFEVSMTVCLDLIICQNSSQSSGKHLCLPVYYIIKDGIKDTNDSQMKRYTGLGLEWSQVLRFLSPWSWGASPSQFMDLFTNTEAPQTPCNWDFQGGFIS